jgi:anti-sigma factor RsiW
MKSKKIKMIHCRDAAKHICENLDEKVNSPVCRAIKRHLQECPACSANLASLKRTIGLYRRYRAPKLSSVCHRNLMAKLSSMR